MMATLGVAGAGLVLGHWLAYAINEPHALARPELLRDTGHAYLPYATQIALLAGAIGLVGLFLTRLTRGERVGSFAGDVVRLAGVQSAAFLAMEIGERLLSGSSLHDLTHGPLLVTGLGVQLLIAVAGTLALRLTEHAAEAAESLGHASPVPSAPSLVTGTPLAAAVVPMRPAMRATASRAPPSLP